MLKMTLAKRLTVMSSIGILSLMLITGVAWRVFSQAKQSLITSADNARAVRTQTLIDMMHDALRADVLALQLAKTSDERQAILADTKEHAANMNDWIDEHVDRIESGSFSTKAVEAVLSSSSDVRKYSALAVALTSNTGDVAPDAVDVASFFEQFKALEGKLAKAGAAVLDSAESAAQEESRNLSNGLWLLKIVAVIAIIVTGVFSYRIAKVITGRINSLKVALDRVAAKDLTVQITDGATDEIGSMANSLTLSVESTRNAMNAIRAGASSLTSQSQLLAGLSSQLGSSAEQTSFDVGSVATNSTSVNEGMRTVSESTEALSLSINEISESTSRVAAIAQHAVTVAGETTLIVGKLGESSDAISSVIDTITSIAAKTNLLALNATIEAARAGTAGRGFAVVATEVKDLAIATGKATDEIRERIRAIRADTKGSIVAIEQITSIVGEISTLQNTIAAAVEEQAVTTQEITRSLGGAAASSGDITNSIGRVAEGAINSSDGAGEVKGAAVQLTQLADELERLVSEFRVSV